MALALVVMGKMTPMEVALHREELAEIEAILDEELTLDEVFPDEDYQGLMRNDLADAQVRQRRRSRGARSWSGGAWRA